MRTDRPIIILTLCGILAFLPSCATTTAPAKWLPKPDETQTETLGGWINVRTKTNDQTQHLLGELIAIHADSIFVLTGPDLIALPKMSITMANLTRYISGHWVLIPWTLLGFVSTLSHGYFLVFTAPAWILFGSISTIAQSRAPQMTKLRKTSWDKFAQYARFPQGLPPNLDRQSLVPENITVYQGKDIGPNTFEKGTHLWITYFSNPNKQEISNGVLYKTDATTLTVQTGNLSQKTIAYSDIMHVWITH
jgi:hypothetical protein